jgi:hypothetical protein
LRKKRRKNLYLNVEMKDSNSIIEFEIMKRGNLKVYAGNQSKWCSDVVVTIKSHQSAKRKEKLIKVCELVLP